MTTAILEQPKEPAQEDVNSRSILLSEIVPSKTNPGRAFNPERDTELMESIKVHGVMQPILIRPLDNLQKGKRFEVVGGERRYSCSIEAGKTHIPAVVRKLTDVEALELQTIENDQRQDLDPMAKAAAFRRLWDAYEKSGDGKSEQRIDRMCERLGRKPRTVWNLLSLSNIVEAGQKLLSEGKIMQSHAYEIARRPQKEQKDILEWLEEELEYGGCSVRDLKEYIRENCDHKLDSAPFPKDDATLFAKAGACTACPKNSAVNPDAIEPEEGKRSKGAICTDGECFKTKVANHLVRIEQQAKKSGKEAVRISGSYFKQKGVYTNGMWTQVKEGSCKYEVIGVIIDDGNLGHQVHVCIATNICKTHWGASSSRDTGRISRPRTESEKKAMPQKQRNNVLDQAYRTAATAAMRKSVKALGNEDLRDVALAMANMTDRRLLNPIFSAMGWKTSNRSWGTPVPVKQIAALKPADCASFIALMTVASKILPGLQPYWPDETKVSLDGIAKRHNVPLEKIHQQAAAPLQEKWKMIDAKKKGKGKPAQTSAAKKKKAA